MRSRLLALAACALFLTGESSARADTKSDALIKKARQVAAGAKTLSATVQAITTSGSEKEVLNGEIRLMKPASSSIKLTRAGARDSQLILSDGKDLVIVNEAEKQFV